MISAGTFSCPDCSGVPVVTPALFAGRIPCHGCGRNLWYVAVQGPARFFRYEDAPAVSRHLLDLLEQASTREVLMGRLLGGRDAHKVIAYMCRLEEELERAGGIQPS